MKAVLETMKEKEKVKILLVEDSVVNQRLLVIMLEKYGYKADVVNNGKEALDVLEKVSYDIIFMDLQMPVMGGIETTELIREKEKNTGKHIPIIALTAYITDTVKEKCFQAGIDDYMLKPFKPASLAEAIEKRFAIKVLPHKVIDTGTVIGRLAGDAVLYKEIIELYLADTPGQLEMIKEAFHRNDLSCVKALSHKLKGSSINIGANNLSLICNNIELEIEKKHLEGLPELLLKLDEEFQLLKSLLNSGQLEILR
jgi:two-component system, sensor histidine kinase and response regulator